MNCEGLPFNPGDVHVETKTAQMDALIMWLVVDSLQRLHTIQRFVVEGSLRLKGLEIMTECNGKRFSQLSRELQRRIEETEIIIHKIMPGTPEAVRYEIFSRVNTGGTPLNAQEIRHAMNPGYFTDMLARLARSDEFKKAVIKGVSSKRMEDQECVLRFMAFTLFPPDHYSRRKVDDFLNEVMRLGNSLSPSQADEYGERFLRAMRVSHEIFGKNAFRKYDSTKKFNKALFEAVSVNIVNLTPEEQETLIAGRISAVKKIKTLLKSDNEFIASISEGTGASAKVRCRVMKVKAVLEETLRSLEF